MTDDNNTEAIEQATPNPDLRTLERLIGTWKVTGDTEGTESYEWADGGFFLLQHVELAGTKGLQVIGHEHKYGEDPSADIRSRYYGFGEGETLDYTWELAGDTLTIWMGDRGSPAYYEGTFNDDNTVLDGGWNYPGGGGYRVTATKI